MVGMIDTNWIYAALSAAAVGGVYYLYRKYRAKLTLSALEADVSHAYTVTADSLIADAKAVIADIEAWAAEQTHSVTALVEQKTGIEGTIATTQADIQKVTDFANKVKALL